MAEAHVHEMHEELRTATPGMPKRRASDTASTVASKIIATAVILTLCYVAKLVLITLFVSVLFAFALEPIVDISCRFKVPRPIGAFLALMLVAALLYAGLYGFYAKAVDFVDQWPQYSVKVRNVVMRFQERAAQIQNQAIPQTAEDKRTVKVQQTTSWGEFLTSSLGTVTETLLLLSFIPFLTFFMLTWQEHVRAATVMLFRMENRNTAYITMGRIAKMMRSFIGGNIIIGIILSIMSMIVFASLHLPYWYFLGPISGFLSIIPYLGVVLAIAPPVVAGMGQMHGGGITAIIITVFVLHLLALNVLYPKLIGKRLQLNPLAVTVALMFWGWLWGAMGLILAVPMTAAMKTIFDNVDSLRPYGAWLGE